MYGKKLIESEKLQFFSYKKQFIQQKSKPLSEKLLKIYMNNSIFEINKHKQTEIVDQRTVEF